MWPSIFLTSLAVVLAFGTGSLWLELDRSIDPGPVQPAVLHELVRAFAANTVPVATIAIADVVSPDDWYSLVNPGSRLPRTHEYPFDEIRALQTAVREGKDTLSPPLRDPALVKALTWHRWRIGTLAALPSDFFHQPPYMHPCGASYAALALELPASGRRRTDIGRPAWVTAQLRTFHLGELMWLSRLPYAIALDNARAVLAGLGNDELAALAASNPLVLSSGHILILRETHSSTPTIPTYTAYLRESWDRMLLGTHYRLTRCLPGVPHLLTLGSFCWQVDLGRLRRHATARLSLQLGGLGLLTVCVVWMLLRQVAERTHDAHRRRFMLQTLTHELRTPVASLSVTLETMRERFDQLPEDGQTAFLRLCDDMQRLTRVVEASRQYLHCESKGELIRLSTVPVESVNGFIAELLEAYPTVSFHALEDDVAARLDRYWTGLCVTNLVQNALTHGQPPVRVRLFRSHSTLSIEVEDAGTCSFADLAAMSSPFVRGPASQGSGLGLSIVTTLARSMGGRLSFAPRPSRFTFSLEVRPP